VEREAPVVAGHSLEAILVLAWLARHPSGFRGPVPVVLPCYRSPAEAHRHVADVPEGWKRSATRIASGAPYGAPSA
jgi:pimeloyl-ACP methyl ester carboxylesterase